MIEIKCSKAAYERIIEACAYADKCVLGKSAFTCYGLKLDKRSLNYNCKECLREHIKRSDTE